MSCCRWFTPSCGGLPPRGWLMSSPGTLSSPRRSFTKPGCGWPGATGCNSRTGPTFLARRPRRRILIERARRRIAAKRGGGAERIALDEIDLPAPVADDDRLLELNDALERFAALEARKAELVKLRYFVGMSFKEAATALDIAVPTAKQWWAYARAWLTAELRSGASR